MFGRILTLVVLAAAIALSLMLQSTNPVSAGPVGIFAVFFLLYVVIAGCMTWAIYGVSKTAVYLVDVLQFRYSKLKELTIQQAYYYSSVLAFAPIILLGMQSVGDLGMYEVGLVMVLVVIGVFYVKKQTN